MGKRACSFKKNDIKRAVDAARSSNVEVGGVRVTNHPDGSTSIEVIAARPDDASAPDAGEWDTDDAA